MRLPSAGLLIAALAGCSTPTAVPEPAPEPAPAASVPVPAPAAPPTAPNPPAPPTATPSATPTAPAAARTMPAYTPSGVKEEYLRVKALKEATRNPRVAEKERADAKVALAEALAGVGEKWKAREVPAPEALMYSFILKEAEKHAEAVVQLRRYLVVCPPDANNFVNATTMLIGELAAIGDFEEAEVELERARGEAFRSRDVESTVAETSLAVCQMKAGRLADAARHFESLAVTGPGDPEAAIYGVDCWLRSGEPEKARALARRAVTHFGEGRFRNRMESLVRQAEAIGKPAPDFSGARWWKGTGGPVTPEAMRGRVVVTFSFNLQTQWLRFFMRRVRALHEYLESRGVLLVGIARLAHFDPVRMGVREEMTEEEELDFFERWARQEDVRFPLALGGCDPDTALRDAWLGEVIPCFVVVGKDGKVFYVRTGKDDEHIAVLREMVDRALDRP